MPLSEQKNNSELLEIPNSSLLHRLDPRTKLLLTALFTTLVFIVDVLPVAAGQMVFFVALCIAGRIPLKRIFPHYKLLLFLVAFVVTLQVFFGTGLRTGLMISCRIVALTVLMPTLTMTTEARILALGITRLGVNYRAAHIITSTLNLIPTFETEARLIIDARRLRGVASPETGNIFRRLGEYQAIVLPLMIKAMRQAQVLSLAMDARAFGAFRTRTWLQGIQFSGIDYTAFAAGILYSAIAVTANYMLQG
jgi:energy-coupling factor transport system permease protein